MVRMVQGFMDDRGIIHNSKSSAERANEDYKRKALKENLKSELTKTSRENDILSIKMESYGDICSQDLVKKVWEEPQRFIEILQRVKEFKGG